MELFKMRHKWRKGGFHTNPNLGWGLILIITLGVIFAFAFYGIILFMNTQKESVAEESGNPGKIVIIKKARLQKALDYFQSKQEKSSEILNTPAPVIDPSV